MNVLAFRLCVAMAGLISCGTLPAVAEEATVSPPVVLPVLRAKASDAIKVNVRFQNTFATPLKYFGMPQDKRPMGLNIWICKDGKVMPNDLPCQRILAFAESVQQLPPGKYVDVPFVIPWGYELAPGTYEVRMRYHVGKGTVDVQEFGITPLTIDEQIYWLEIVEPEKKPEQVEVELE